MQYNWRLEPVCCSNPECLSNLKRINKLCAEDKWEIVNVVALPGTSVSNFSDWRINYGVCLVTLRQERLNGNVVG